MTDAHLPCLCAQCIDIMEAELVHRVRRARVRTLIRRDPTLEPSARTLEHSHVVDVEAATPSLADVEYDRLLRQAYALRGRGCWF